MKNNCYLLLCADYETLRALDADNAPTASMTDEEINALPVHKYKVSGSQRLVMVWHPVMQVKFSNFQLIFSLFFFYFIWLFMLYR